MSNYNELVSMTHTSTVPVEPHALTLEKLVRLRTCELEAALQKNEEITTELRQVVERFRRLTELSSDWYWEQDAQFRFTMVSNSLQLTGGVSPNNFIGKTRWEATPDIGSQTWIRHQEQLHAHQPFSDLEYHITLNEKDHWFSISGEPLFDLNGAFMGYWGTGKYITARKKIELMHQEQSNIIEMIATNIPLKKILDRLMLHIESQTPGIMASVLLVNTEGSHLRLGAAPSLPIAYSEKIDGIAIGPNVGSCGTAIYRRQQVIVTDIQTDPLWHDYRQLASAHGLRSCWSTPIISHNNNIVGTFALYSATVRAPSEAEHQLIQMATRIAGIAIERCESEQRILHMAHHDALTGLPNRLLLELRLSQAILYARRSNHAVSVVFIDLDNFKLINDSLGHNTGDEILRAVAHRMTDCVRASDTVARLGGDEFVIIMCEQTNNPDDITTVLQKIQESITQTIHVGQTSLQVTCSMGLARFPGDGEDINTLLMNADAAMYRAKEYGRNNYQFYMTEMNAHIRNKLELQESLRNAIERNELQLRYQPQINLNSGKIFGVEALIRWHHPVMGIISPADFIPLAEQTGLIVAIGNWVLKTACQQNKDWQAAGIAPITISVNVSARQFKEQTLINGVKAALKESGLHPHFLELELTESLIMQDLSQSIATMHELNEMGVQLAIDDFGTGYSSLSSLKSFPINRLKIDQSFVRFLCNHEDDDAIVKAVISLGHQLKLNVIAEGVETTQQLDFLRNNECDEIQGYLFSKPVSATDITKMLQDTSLPIPKTTTNQHRRRSDFSPS